MRIRRLGVLGIALCAALTAAPTPSVRVVEVRVGNHPTFTRVVFELDGRSGYRIEKSASELVVTLDAESGVREITTRSPLVAGVSVEAGERGAVARVRLRRATPLVKEMLLANPNRIVLDLMLPEELAAKPAPKPAKAPAPKSEVAAQTEPPPKPVAPAPPPKPPVAVKAPEPAAEPVPVVAVKPPAPAPAVVPKPPEKAPEAAKPPAPPAPLDAVTPREVATPPEAVSAPGVEKPAEPWKPPGLDKAPEPGVKRPAPVPAPAPVREPKGLFGLEWGGLPPLRTLALIAAAALVFVGVVVSVLRRRSRETPLDVLETAREAGAPPLTRDEEDDGAMGGLERMTQAAGRTTETALPVAGPGLFDDEAEKESEMEMGAGLSIEREPMTRTAAMPLGASGGSELDSLVRQLEKRLGQLETRLDEATAARERLERQVAAQSEELRVQRAAIARTQRALRGMTRGGEEQATEPALRDPSKPSPGRGSA